MNPRKQALSKIAGNKISVEDSIKPYNIEAEYGVDSFGLKTMEAYLSKPIYKRLRETIKLGVPLDQAVADDVAHAGFLQQQIGLKADEVHFMRVDVGLIVGGVVLACETVRVIPVGQQAYFDVHAFFQQHVNASDAGLYAGTVSVIQHGDVVGEAVNQTNLVGSQRSAR